MNEINTGRFAPEFSVSMLKEVIELVWRYVSETRKQKAKLAEKYIYIILGIYIYIFQELTTGPNPIV